MKTSTEELDYKKHDDDQLRLLSIEQFHGQDEIAVSIRPADGGRCVVKVSTSVLNMATDFIDEMARELPE